MEFLAALGSQFVGGVDFDFPSPLVTLDELKRASAGAPADLSALPLGEDLTDSRGVQWPVPDHLSASSKGTPRRHMGQDGGTGFPTATGKALAIPQEHPGIRRPPDPTYPMTAIMSLEGSTWWDGLQYQPYGGDVVRPREVETAYVEVSPEDAEDLGLSEGSRAVVTSSTASVELPVRVGPSGTVKGHVFIPWGVDEEVQRLAPSFPMDVDGVPPWSTFNVSVELVPL
jgi:assimilatory nitrate reductase catalytic subunit